MHAPLTNGEDKNMAMKEDKSRGQKWLLNRWVMKAVLKEEKESERPSFERDIEPNAMIGQLAKTWTPIGCDTTNPTQKLIFHRKRGSFIQRQLPRESPRGHSGCGGRGAKYMPLIEAVKWCIHTCRTRDSQTAMFTSWIPYLQCTPYMWSECISKQQQGCMPYMYVLQWLVGQNLWYINNHCLHCFS